MLLRVDAGQDRFAEGETLTGVLATAANEQLVADNIGLRLVIPYLLVRYSLHVHQLDVVPLSFQVSHSLVDPHGSLDVAAVANDVAPYPVINQNGFGGLFRVAILRRN